MSTWAATCAAALPGGRFLSQGHRVEIVRRWASLMLSSATPTDSLFQIKPSSFPERGSEKAKNSSCCVFRLSDAVDQGIEAFITYAQPSLIFLHSQEQQWKCSWHYLIEMPCFCMISVATAPRARCCCSSAGTIGF